MGARKPGKRDSQSLNQEKAGAPQSDQPQQSAKSRWPVQEDMRFQRRQWQFERVGWTLMLVLIIASLAGVFGGGGPLQDAEASSTNGMNVHYARFARRGAPVSVSVQVPEAGAAGAIQLRVSEKYFDSMTIRSIVPTPATTALAGGQYLFIFESPSPRAPTTEATTIYLELESKSAGSVSGSIGLNDGTPVAITHFIYP